VTAHLRDTSGTAHPLELGRWHGAADAVELALLEGLPDPVLDIGCGPGRIVAALAERGRPVLGIDPAAIAIDDAVAGHAPTLRRSVFEPLPGEGRWGAALLLDGNVGIGGDPEELLRRVRELLAPAGHLLVEVEPPGVATEVRTVRVEHPDGAAGPWFRWARVGADDFAAMAQAAGLVPVGLEVGGDRWFGRAVRP
jgi:SAM-dependent methyltransferase